LLEHAPADCVIYSVDISSSWYRDTSKLTGYAAQAFYDQSRYPEWRLFAGQDIYQCIDEIGNDIDFVILDTRHCLPGEILSFLVVMPYMREGAMLFLHDISLHMQPKLALTGEESHGQHFCTPLLFTAIPALEKYLSEDAHPNSALVRIEPTRTIRDIYMLINVLFLDWVYLPVPHVLEGTLNCMARFYSLEIMHLAHQAVNYNCKRLDAYFLLNKKIIYTSRLLRKRYP